MAKQNEMDSLVAGMQFMMTDIVGECYTFKPNDWTPRSATKRQEAANGSQKTPQQVPVDKVSFKQSNESNGGHRTLDAKETNIPRVDQWWTSKKVQRDNVMASDSYPYLLVSIGTGVSILRVDGPRKHERISGSTSKYLCI